MRPSQKPNRNRGRGGRKPNGANVNRVYESNGPEGKVRGTPQQIVDKYLSLAGDAQILNNRVAAESFFQHAEHYQRLLIEAAGARQERRDIQPQDQEQPDPERREAPAAANSDGAAMGTDGMRVSSRGGRFQRQPEVSGLTTIDSGSADNDSLLVDAEDLSASQPRRRRPYTQEQTPALDQPREPAPAAESPSE